MLPTPCAETIRFFPRVSGVVLIFRGSATLDTTSTDHSNLGGITVCRATRVSSWFGDFVTVKMSFATTGFFNFSLS